MSLWRGVERLVKQRAPKGSSYDPRRVAYGFRSGQPISPEFDGLAAIEEGFSNSEIVYTCVTRKMDMGGSVPWRYEVINDAGKWEGAGPDHPRLYLARAVEHPSRGGHWDRPYLIGSGIAHVELVGNSLIGYSRARVDPTAIQLKAELPFGVEPIPDPIDHIRSYKYPTESGGQGYWRGEDIIHTQLINPRDPYWGQSRLQALARTVDTEVAAEKRNLHLMRNGGTPDAIIVDSTIRDGPELDQRRERMRDRYTDPAYAGLPWLVGGEVGKDISAIKLGMSNTDLQLIEGSGLRKEAVIRAFGFHPVSFGGDPSLNNLRSATRYEWSRAVIPVLDKFSSSFTRRLVPREWWGQERIAPDYSGIAELQVDKDQAVKEYERLVRNGVPPKDAIAFAGLSLPDDRPGYERSYFAGGFEDAQAITGEEGSGL